MVSAETARKSLLPETRVRTPAVLQLDVVECGAACLGIILAYYGRYVPLEQLRRDCGVSRDGSRAANILSAAKLYGLRGKGLKKDLASLGEVAYPYIVFWNFNHFVVVEGCRKDRVYLSDPAHGRRSVSTEEFEECYTGVVLTLQPDESFTKGGVKPAILPGLLRRVNSSWSGVLYCVLAGFLLVLPGIVVPSVLKAFIDRVVIAGDTDWARPLVLCILAAALLRGALVSLQLRALTNLRFKISAVGSSQFFLHLLKLPPAYYAQRYSGEIAERLKANERIARVLSGPLTSSFINMAMVLFYFAAMLAMDVALACIAAAIATADLVAIRLISLLRRDGIFRLAAERGKLAAVSLSGLQSIRMLKSSARESAFFARWSGGFAKVMTGQQEVALSSRVVALIPGLFGSLMSLLILVIGGWRVMEGSLTIGALLAIQSLAISFLEPVDNLMRLGASVQELEGDVARLEDVLRNPVDPVLGCEASDQEERAPRLAGHVRMRNVTFGYDAIGKPLLRDFYLEAEPGQRVAIVGGSGSGKSTVLRLLAGLYQPWSGEILFDGSGRADIPRDILSSSLASVEQDAVLFGGSISENLTLWDSTVSEVDLRKACEDAAIWATVASMPGGLHATLSEAAMNMSGGQRQRLEIARALVNAPSILLLDEATSSLDAETEYLVEQNLRKRGCTCIIVSHRLSTIRTCDEIVVLRRGEVVERGNHEDLIARNGEYRRLLTADSYAG